MRGFIIDLRKAKNEDSIATLLTPFSVGKYYRFFGARHSILQLGHLVDFEIEDDRGHFMPRLRKLSHFGFPWLYDNNRLLIWHNFLKLLASHLCDADEVGSFYYELLLQSAKKWDKQNPKRIVCDSFVALLEYEGRVHTEDYCYICEEPLLENIALMRAFIPAHSYCIYGCAINKKKFFNFLKTKKSIYYNDEEIDLLYTVIMKGL